MVIHAGRIVTKMHLEKTVASTLSPSIEERSLINKNSFCQLFYAYPVSVKIE